ncbi:MAG: PadR family transcriptional regulator [Gemmatimonadota bacterium]|nr:PadR family transcriptional regulator [Gemmatimonadota bacterium]
MPKRKFLGEFEQVVLLAVAQMRGAGYGTALRRDIRERCGRSATIGAIYATLERLEAKGFVTSREGESTGERGGRSRRYFSLSESGTDALRRSRDMLDSMWDGLDLDAPADSEGLEVA